jgi:hypothetical protein
VSQVPVPEVVLVGTGIDQKWDAWIQKHRTIAEKGICHMKSRPGGRSGSRVPRNDVPSLPQHEPKSSLDNSTICEGDHGLHCKWSPGDNNLLRLVFFYWLPSQPDYPMRYAASAQMSPPPEDGHWYDCPSHMVMPLQNSQTLPVRPQLPRPCTSTAHYTVNQPRYPPSPLKLLPARGAERYCALAAIAGAMS